MEVQLNTNQIYMLMSEHSLSEPGRLQISNKIHTLINFMNYLNTIKKADSVLKNELTSIHASLAAEQKSTAKMIVAKNNLLSKNLIKSMSAQKENLLQLLEISQLRLEAELKKLNEKLSYPVIKTEVSFFSKLFTLFKVPFKNTSRKKVTSSVNHTREKINLTASKLNTLEKRKEDLAKEFGCTGTESLRYLNQVTYHSFLPVYDTSDSHLENLKNKITILNN